MTNAPFTSIGDYRDIESLRFHAEAVAAGADPEAVMGALHKMSRDHARTPMQWDDSPSAGFTSGTPWLAVNPNHVRINARAARADPDSVFHHYRRLIELRHTEPVVAHGDFTMLLADDERVYAFTRRLDGVELLVVANLSSQAALAPVPDAAAWARAELLLGNCGEPASRDELLLQPWEARIHRRKRDRGA